MMTFLSAAVQNVGRVSRGQSYLISLQAQRAKFSTSVHDFSHVKTVGIIGAGVAGLQMARACRDHGLQCRVFDKAPDVGGLWRDNYLGFGIQVPKVQFEFPDFPAPYKDFADGKDVQTYIVDYAKKFSLYNLVDLNTEVHDVSKRTDGKRGWTFRLTKDGKEVAESFDYAVVCTGMYSTTPFLPSYDGLQDFKGTIIHSSQYKSSKQVEGKRVVVIGGGKSSLDIVADVAGKAASSSLLYRHAHWGTPRDIAGVIPFQYVFLSRFGQALVSWYKGAWPTAGTSVKTAHTILKSVMGPVFRIVEWLFALQLGHKGDYRPRQDVVKDFYGYAQVLDSTFKSLVASGKVGAVRGEVASLSGSGLRLSSGATLPCDVLICATGFAKSYAYLPPDVVAQLGVEKDGLYLYRHCIPPRVADLAFVGSEVATISNIATHAILAQWLARALTGRVRLPGKAAMEEEVATMKAWKRSWMSDTGSRANLVLLHQVNGLRGPSPIKSIQLPALELCFPPALDRGPLGSVTAGGSSHFAFAFTCELARPPSRLQACSASFHPVLTRLLENEATLDVKLCRRTPSPPYPGGWVLGVSPYPVTGTLETQPRGSCPVNLSLARFTATTVFRDTGGEPSASTSYLEVLRLNAGQGRD